MSAGVRTKESEVWQQVSPPLLRLQNSTQPCFFSFRGQIRIPTGHHSPLLHWTTAWMACCATRGGGAADGGRQAFGHWWARIDTLACFLNAWMSAGFAKWTASVTRRLGQHTPLIPPLTLLSLYLHTPVHRSLGLVVVVFHRAQASMATQRQAPDPPQ